MEREELKEGVTHGNVSFPLACYRWDTNKQFFVRLHWHDETELVFFQKGKFIVDINMKKYRIDAPALMFITSGDIHSIIAEEGCKESAVVFDLKMLSFEYFDAIQYQIIRPLLEKKIQFPKFILSEDPIWTEMLSLYRKIFNESKHKKLASYMKVKAYIYQLIAVLYQNKKLQYAEDIKEYDSYKIENAKKVLIYIRENYNQKISLDDMAKRMGMNTQYFCRYFKKLTGKTPTAYINEIRIEKAAEYLLQSDRKILDIAMACGYENMGYFIKRFKEYKQVSPSEYRKQRSQNSVINYQNK